MQQLYIMLLQSDISPQVTQSLIFGGVIMLIFVLISVLLIRRNRNRLSVSLTMYFMSVALGLLVNFIYRLLEALEIINLSDNEAFFSYMNITTLFFTTLAGIFLLNFNLTLFYSTRIFSKKKQTWLVVIYAIVLLGFYVIQLTVGGVTWIVDPRSSEGSDMVPLYSFLLGGYFLIASQIVFIIIIVYALKITKKMGKNKYSKKYIRNILGILFFDLQMIGAFIANTFGDTDNPWARYVGFFTQLILILPGAFLLAFGLKKEPET